MKDYLHMPGWRLNKSDNKPTIKHSILMLTTHGVAEGEWDGNEWIQYRWSAKVKDSDVHYWLYLEDLTQLEKEGDSLQQKQPDVDLAENIEMEWDSFNKHIAEYGKESEDVVWLNWFSFVDIATYFYKLGRKGGKEEEPMDLEKELENRIKSLEPYFEALDNYCTEKIMSLCDGTKVKPSLDIVDITDCIIDVAKHFYELGRKGGSK